MSQALARLALTAAAAGTAALLLTACTPPASTDPTSDVQTTRTAGATATSTGNSDEPVDGEEVPDEEVPNGRIDATAAVEAALLAVPGDVVELELERERTTIVWEVGVLGADGSGTEVTIDSQSGEVLRQETLRLSSVQSTAPAVTAVQAIDIARDTVDGRVRAMDLDTEQGVVVWEVEVIGTRGGTEIYIDATSGDVVKQERMS